jgi:hypothetical protein
MNLRPITYAVLWIVSLAAPTEASSCQASWKNYGRGLAGTNGVPVLVATANPILGTTIDTYVGNSSARPTLGIFYRGFHKGFQPTVYGGYLLLDPRAAAYTIRMIPPSGLLLPVSIPNNPGLCGDAIYGQVIQFDPGASKNMAFSRGLELRLGY